MFFVNILSKSKSSRAVDDHVCQLRSHLLIHYMLLESAITYWRLDQIFSAEPIVCAAL